MDGIHPRVGKIWTSNGFRVLVSPSTSPEFGSRRSSTPVPLFQSCHACLLLLGLFRFQVANVITFASFASSFSVSLRSSCIVQACAFSSSWFLGGLRFVCSSKLLSRPCASLSNFWASSTLSAIRILQSSCHKVNRKCSWIWSQFLPEPMSG